jgi:hypothetical protein
LPGMPPRGHPAHPEMQGLYGRPGAAPSPVGPTPEELAELQRKRAVAERALSAAEPRIKELLRAFVHRMRDVPPGEVVTRDSGIEKVHHLRTVPTYRRIGAPFAKGWYVKTPIAAPVVTDTVANEAQSETRQVPGLVVLTNSDVWSCVPSETQLEVLGEVSTLRGLLPYTHRRHWALGTDVADLTARFEALLEAAAKTPWQPRPAMTRREAKRADKEFARLLDEREYGPGGKKAYWERTYGPQTPWGKLKRWVSR